MSEQPQQITFDDFKRLEMKVATVLRAERVEGTDRLLRLLVDTGEPESRTLVAGIGDLYEAEALVNKQVIVVTNLAPAKIRGIVSEGMILAVGEKNVQALLTVDRAATPGAGVR